MKAGDLIEALERFFLDVIGTVVPGMAMLFGFCYVTGEPLTAFTKVMLDVPGEQEWMLIIGFAYVIGHAITSLGSSVVRKGLEHAYQSETVREAVSGQKDTKPEGWPLGFVVPEQELSDNLIKDPVFKSFRAAVLKRIPSLTTEANQVKGRTWRSLALSVAPEKSHLVYRFTFLSLLNLGVATVLIVTSVMWVALAFAKGFSPTLSVIPLNKWIFLMLIACPLFLERYYNFARIAFQLPISMALAKLEVESQEVKEERTRGAVQLESSPGKLKVYLAGGFSSGWQSRIMQEVQAPEYFDPRSHGLKSKAEYTAWDLEAIRRSHCVFAYLEATNPGGYALALEVGFAKALGKFVIFVDEKSASSPQSGRYLEMVAEASDVYFTTLPDGIAFLQHYRRLA